MVSSLPPETWLRIFPDLHRQLPTPQKAASNSRESLRQPDLLACLLVNKEFYNIASTILYQSAVATDRFPSFVSGIQNQHIPGITPKITLLGGVRRLYIEYTEKEMEGDLECITYEDLHNYGGFPYLTDEDNGRVHRRDYQGLREGCELSKAWDELFTKDGRLREVFTSLHTLVTAGGFGQQHEFWQSADGRKNGGETETYLPIARDIGARRSGWILAINLAQRGLFDFIRKSPSMRHFCQNGSILAPLSLGCKPFMCHPRVSELTIAAHEFHLGMVFYPVWVGVESRHYIHAARLPDYESARPEPTNVALALIQRHKAAEQGILTEDLNWNLRGGYYCPAGPRNAGWRKIVTDIATRVAQLSDGLVRGMPEWLDRDQDDWDISHIAPSCRACLWEMEE